MSSRAGRLSVCRARLDTLSPLSRLRLRRLQHGPASAIAIEALTQRPDAKAAWPGTAFVFDKASSAAVAAVRRNGAEFQGRFLNPRWNEIDGLKSSRYSRSRLSGHIMDHALTGDKNLRFLSALIGDGRDRSIRQVAEEMDIPLSTAHRMAAAFVRAGFLAATGKGTYGAGLELMNLAAKGDRVKVLKYTVRPHLQRLASEVGYVAHLGILENEMVTYILKVQGGRSKVFTKAGMQLEAYCSAIGKMLLASASEENLERYLADGPFVPLTKNTIADPVGLRRALDDIRKAGFAFDGEEAAEGLICVAVPLRNRRGDVEAAISLAAQSTRDATLLKDHLLAAIRECAQTISQKL